MEVSDKGVSTDEISYPPPHNTYLEVARLEAILNTLVEHKVEAIKNENIPSILSTPKSLARRLKLNSTSTTTSSKEKTSGNHTVHSNRKHRRRKYHDEIDITKGIKTRKTGRSKQRVSSSSPENARCNQEKYQDRTPPLSDDDAFPQYDLNSVPCCCGEDISEIHISPIKKRDDEYISLKIEEYDDFELDMDEYEERRARRKRRKRRRKKRRLKSMAVAVIEDIKVIDPDELPQRARWTIVATACLLLFMCLMLVGVTLRMAPLIDDMVRKENEELMNSLHREEDPVQTPLVPIS